MLTKQHYSEIAAVLAAEWSLSKDLSAKSGRQVGWTVRNITLSLADKFKQDNARFDRDLFYAAVFGTSDIDEINAQIIWSPVS